MTKQMSCSNNIFCRDRFNGLWLPIISRSRGECGSFFSEYSTHGVMIVRRNWLWLIFWRVIGKYNILFRSQSSNLFFKHKRVFYHFVDFVCMFHYRPIRALHEFCLNFDWSKLTRNVFFRKNLSAYFIFIIRDFWRKFVVLKDLINMLPTILFYVLAVLATTIFGG